MGDYSDYVKKASSKELAARVVAYRLLGVNQELAIKCMEELSERESVGEEFDYRAYIKEEFDKSPKPYLEKSQTDLYKAILKSIINHE